MGILDSVIGAVTGIPIVGDLIGAGAEHASAKNLQNDSQAHDSAMFGRQVEHDKNMFGLESDFNAKQARLSYDRERQFARDMPGLQMEGLRSAGLNPLLAATGGFRASSGGTQQASAKASSSAKGSGGGSPPGARLMIGETQKRYAEAELAREKVNTEKSLQVYNNARAVAEGARGELTGTKDEMLQFAKSLLQLADTALKEFQKSGKFGNTKSNIESIIDNIEMVLKPSNNIEITEHVRRQLMKKQNQLKAYRGRTGGRNRRNK